MKALIPALFLAFAATAQAAPHSHGDHPSVHGMAVVGKDSIYLSHLPMFHSPHDYQVIFEAEFDQKTKEAYLASKADSEETVYTIAPETFVLPEMVAQPRPFKAQLFRGHFERGGELLAGAEVKIKRVVYFRKLDPSQPKMASPQFFLFGKGEEKFLAHEIAARPDFDQILAVNMPGEEGQVFVASGKENALVSSGWLPLQALGERAGITAEVKSLYLEEGDLSF